jgi:hypothetical protein
VSDTDYSDLSAVYVNCTLKRSPEKSNTRDRHGRRTDWDAGCRLDYENPEHRV